MAKSGLGQMYRRLSSKLLDLVVTPHAVSYTHLTLPTTPYV